MVFEPHCGERIGHGVRRERRQPHELWSRGLAMRRTSLRRERDEDALTAVIEFLSAFTLFLMILTAFLSLAQLQMGSNDPDVDRLDRAASLGLDRLTSGEGWFVPQADGLDYGLSLIHI